MKKHVKQILAMLLAVMMVLALASCTKTPASSAAPTPASSGTEPASSAAGPQKEEDIVIHAVSAFYTFSGDTSKLFITNHIRETLGITIDWETYQSPEDFKPKFALQMTDGNMADLYFHLNLSVADQNKYGQDGYLANFKDYFDVMPNFKKYFEENTGWAAYITDENGDVYGFPRAYASEQSRPIANANVKKSWVEAAGLKSVPTTPDGLYEMLVYFRDHDMDGDGDPSNEIPLSMMSNGAGVRIDWNLRGMFGIYDVNENYNLMVKDGKVVLANTTDNYRAYLTWMNKLFKEDLLDKEFATQTVDQMRTKTKSGIAGLFSDWGGIASATDDSTKGLNLEYLTWNGGSSEYQEKPVYVKYPSQSASNKYHISESSKYKERIFKMIDYFFTREGWEIGTYGVEGVHFKYNEPDAYGYKSRNTDGFWEASNYKTYNEWFASEVALDGFNMTQWNEIAEILEKADYDTLKKMMVDGPDYTYSTRAQILVQMADDGVTYVDSFPFLSYTADETKERATLATDITNFLKTAKVEFINGTRPLTDDEWAKFAKQLDDMGVDRLLKIEQAAYDRYVKASK